MTNKKNDKKPMRYELRNVDDLIPYARNARTHSPEQITKLASSIKEFGFISPVIISEDGGILAGHGRVMAAKKLGIEKVPCVIESHLTQAQKRAYVLADNRLALDAGWDDEMLKIEIQELSQSEFDLQSIGFSEYELGRFLKENALSDIQFEKSDSEYDGCDNPADGSSNEIDLDQFDKTNFRHTCPRCGMRFNDDGD